MQNEIFQAFCLHLDDMNFDYDNPTIIRKTGLSNFSSFTCITNSIKYKNIRYKSVWEWMSECVRLSLHVSPVTLGPTPASMGRCIPPHPLASATFGALFMSCWKLYSTFHCFIFCVCMFVWFCCSYVGRGWFYPGSSWGSVHSQTGLDMGSYAYTVLNVFHNR